MIPSFCDQDFLSLLLNLKNQAFKIINDKKSYYNLDFSPINHLFSGTILAKTYPIKNIIS